MPYYPPVVAAGTVPAVNRIPVLTSTTGNIGNSTTTFANITGLSATLAASALMTFEFWVVFTAAANTTSIKVQLTGPTSPTYVDAWVIVNSAFTTTYTSGIVTAFSSAFAGAGSLGATSCHAKIMGSVQNGVNAGTLQVQFASTVAASLVTVQAGSYGLTQV